MKCPITLDFAKDALRDLLALHAKLVTIDNIQLAVAEYYKIKIADLLSKRRNRVIARPRQLAMALAKEFGVDLASPNSERTTLMVMEKEAGANDLVISHSHHTV